MLEYMYWPYGLGKNGKYLTSHKAFAENLPDRPDPQVASGMAFRTKNTDLGVGQAG